MKKTDKQKVIWVSDVNGTQRKYDAKPKHIHLEGDNNTKNTQIMLIQDHKVLANGWKQHSKIVIYDLPMRQQIYKHNELIFRILKQLHHQSQLQLCQINKPIIINPIVIIVLPMLPPGNLYKPKQYIESLFRIIGDEF